MDFQLCFCWNVARPSTVQLIRHSVLYKQTNLFVN